MISISKPIIEKEEKALVNKVLDSGYIVQGPMVDKLEEEFKSLTKSKYAIAVNNGTSALHTALLAIGIRPGDEVITTPFTFIATANSILMANATPVFVDIDEKTFNIDPEKMEEQITDKTKAIIAVDLYGQPADYEALKKIADKYDLVIIGDSAQSVNAKYKDQPIGSVADITCFSLYATKNLMSGEGGMITTDNKEYAKNAELIRHHGQSKEKRYHYFGLGYNYRMTDLHAAIALGQLPKIQYFTDRRREIAKRYTSELQNIEGLITPEEEEDSYHVYHQYTIKLTDAYKYSRDDFQDKLLDKEIQTNIYYPIPLYEFDHLKASKRTDCPVTDKLSKEVVSLPVHPNLTEEEVDYIIKTIKEL